MCRGGCFFEMRDGFEVCDFCDVSGELYREDM